MARLIQLRVTHGRLAIDARPGRYPDRRVGRPASARLRRRCRRRERSSPPRHPCTHCVAGWRRSGLRLASVVSGPPSRSLTTHFAARPGGSSSGFAGTSAAVSPTDTGSSPLVPSSTSRRPSNGRRSGWSRHLRAADAEPDRGWAAPTSLVSEDRLGWSVVLGRQRRWRLLVAGASPCLGPGCHHLQPSESATHVGDALRYAGCAHASNSGDRSRTARRQMRAPELTAG